MWMQGRCHGKHVHSSMCLLLGGLLVPDELLIQMVMDGAVDAVKKYQSLEQAVALDEYIDAIEVDAKQWMHHPSKHL